MQTFFNEEYSPAEMQSFKLHTFIAVACLPFYYLMPSSFGLLMSPYLLFLALMPKPQYLLPIIIHIAYGSQQRYFFCMGCFLYVLVHFTELKKYGLQIIYCLYLSLLPFFLWYVYQKWIGPRYVGGIGEVTGGIGEYFVFSTAFWGTLVVKKINRTFFKGLLIFSFFLLAILSLKGASDGAAKGLLAEIGFFSREVFFAMPLLVAAAVFFFFKRKQGHMLEFAIAGVGSFIIALDFVGILPMKVTFTNLGGCGLAALYVFFSVKGRHKMLYVFHPLLLFIVSFCVMMASASLVEKYGGLYSDEGTYDEMKVTNLDSLFKKIQRKAVDDRAQVWSRNIARVTEIWKTEPIWINTDPYFESEVWVPGKGYVKIVTNMGAHNTYLQLLREYGFYGGLGMLICFVYYFARKKNLEILGKQGSSPTVILLATCLSQGVIGGHTGHYPIQLTFGPVLYSCLGACWRYYYETDRNARIGRMAMESYR